MDRSHEGHSAAGLHGTSEAVLAAALAAACDQFMRGILLLDASGRPLYANLAAREMLATADAMSQQGGRLVLNDGRQQARLDQFRARPAVTAAGVSDSGRLVLQLDRSSGLPAYRVLMTRLALAAVPVAERVFLMMVFDPSTSHRIRAEVLIELYGLTRAEAAVAARLFEGAGVSAIAADTRHSANTVRTHLRAIFRKCQVSSQAQLLQLLALGPRR